MKFINYLTSITGVDIFPLFSLLVFFLFFTALIVYAVKADKNVIDQLKHIPLQSDKDLNVNDGNDEYSR